MKLIIIEGIDCIGKDTLIKGIQEHFIKDYNVCIRHFGKPPKNLNTEDVLDFQFKCFENEVKLISNINTPGYYRYYDDLIIWNRSHLGEYVYSQMFRGGNAQDLKYKLLNFEHWHLENFMFGTYLITLTADPQFALSKEDGQSFSQNFEQKTKELELFKEIHEFSTIKNKIIIKVDEWNTVIKSGKLEEEYEGYIFRSKKKY